MAFDLDGYNTVPERIVEFREKYPDGRLRQSNLQFIEFGGKSWVVYTAEALRTADDPFPAQGTAWEEVPGKTQFTRDSELQNAETAAWGRAIVAALAADTSKGIASREEVRNRQPEAAAPSDQAVADWALSLSIAADVDELKSLWAKAGAAGVSQDPKVIAAKDARKVALSE